MDLLGDVGHVESRFSPFGDSVSVDARYVLGFTPNIPIGSEIILDAPNDTPRLRCLSGSSISSIWRWC